MAGNMELWFNSRLQRCQASTRELVLLAQRGRAQSPAALGSPAQEKPLHNVPGLSLSLGPGTITMALL